MLRRLLAITSLLGGCVVTVDGTTASRTLTGAIGDYPTIGIAGPPTSTPAHQQADLNIKLRGLRPVDEQRSLITYGGPTDPGAPKLNTIFTDRRIPPLGGLYQVGVFGGLALGVESSWSVHVMELEARAGEALLTPSSGYHIGDGATAMVVYADDDSLTLKYTREDSIVSGYAVHLLDLAVDPGLLAAYRQCVAEGRHELPALAGGMRVGAATGRLKVAVRDTGSFMDPRATDWFDAGAGASPAAAPPPQPTTPPAPSTPPAPPASAPAQPACASAGVEFRPHGPLTRCGTVALTVAAPGAPTWVMAGIGAPGSPVTWRGGVAAVACGGGRCQWTFPDVSVPCTDGPYSVHFMTDAQQDDPARGREIASCAP